MKITWQKMVVILIALVAIVVIAASLSDQQRVPKAWFYDLNTGALFAGTSDMVPPVPAPSGDLLMGPPGTHAGVLAYVIEGEGPPAARLTYLQTTTPQVRQALKPPAPTDAGQTLPPVDYDAIMDGTLIARPPAQPGDAPEWVPITSPQGERLLSELLNQ